MISIKAKNVNIKILPKLGDLGYTIYYALNDIHEPVIINFADTIVMDSITEEIEDAFFCQEDYMSETWTYFDEENGVITNIFDNTEASARIRKKTFCWCFQNNR